MVSSVEEEIQSSRDYVDTTRGRTLERLEELFHMTTISTNFFIYLTIGSSRIDDEIIYSWCFIFVKCFDSTSSAATDILIKNFEELVEP